VTGDAIRARRRAREVVGELRWRGMTVPPLYARMAGEFEDLVHTGAYAAWVAAEQHPSSIGGGRRQVDRSIAGRAHRSNVPAWDAAVAATPDPLSA
jgi:hypothetical protein